MLHYRNTDLLYATAEQMELSPEWVTARGVFSITNGVVAGYVSVTHSYLNSTLAASLARNKFVTRTILEKAGLPMIPFCSPAAFGDSDVFLAKHLKIVAKPTTGSNATGITIITHPEQLSKLPQTPLILEKYIEGSEIRYLVLKGAVIAVNSKVYTDGTLTSAIQTSHPQNDWRDDLISTSLIAAKELDLGFCAVDFLVEADGTAHLLEVNSAPGIYGMQFPDKGEGVEVAKLFLEATIAELEARLG